MSTLSNNQAYLKELQGKLKKAGSDIMRKSITKDIEMVKRSIASAQARPIREPEKKITKASALKKTEESASKSRAAKRKSIKAKAKAKPLEKGGSAGSVKKNIAARQKAIAESYKTSRPTKEKAKRLPKKKKVATPKPKPKTPTKGKVDPKVVEKLKARTKPVPKKKTAPKAKSVKVTPPAGYRSKPADVKTDPGTRSKGWEKITKKQPKAKVKKVTPKKKVVKAKAVKKAAAKPVSSAKKMRRMGRAGPMSAAATAAAIAPQAIESLTGPGGVLHRKGKSKKQKPFKATSPMSLTGDVKPKKVAVKKKVVARKKPPLPPAAPKVKRKAVKGTMYEPMGGGRAKQSDADFKKMMGKTVSGLKKPTTKKFATPKKKPARTVAAAQKSGSSTFVNKKGVTKAAVTKEQLKKSGLSLRDYLNKQQGKTRRK